MVDAQLNINIFDGFVYATLFLAGAISLYRGFIREFLSLATWLGGGIIAVSMADDATAFMKQYMNSGMGAAIIGVMGTYFLTVLFLSLLGRMLLRYIKSGADVGKFDNALGLFFGLFKGGMIVVLAFILLTLVFQGREQYPPWLKNASTLPTVQKASLTVAKMLPSFLGKITSLEQLEKEVQATEAAEGKEGAPDPKTVDSLIAQEVEQKRKQGEEGDTSAPPEDGSKSLEQLIQDVTKNSENANGQ